MSRIAKPAPSVTIASRVRGAVYGALVGDALGVPVEFTGREQRRSDPVRGMRSLGSWGQPAGTWSDDGALLLCTLEGLVENLSVSRIGQLYVDWMQRGRWAARGTVFDTLEAALWCVQNQPDFNRAVLAAVNLGGDTDTTGCVAGGLAGALHGIDAIPAEWIACLPRRDEIDALLGRFVSTDACRRRSRR